MYPTSIVSLTGGFRSLPGDETEPSLKPLAKSLDDESAAGPLPSLSDESSLSPEEAGMLPSTLVYPWTVHCIVIHGRD
jgi:hypothetical protein